MSESSIAVATTLLADAARPVLTLAAGAASLRLGWSAGASERRRPVVGLVLAGVALTAAAAHYEPLYGRVGGALTPLGAVVAGWSALALLGLASRGRRASRGSYVAAACLVFGLPLALASGSIFWRAAGAGMRENLPNARGAVCQTTPITCGAAAAAMLVDRYGVRVSEGEMAERANINPILGADAFALARAADAVVRPKGLRGFARHASLPEAVALARPFVAFIQRPGIGGHAIRVVHAGIHGVATLDPLDGSEQVMSPREFIQEWSGELVWVGPNAHG